MHLDIEAVTAQARMQWSANAALRDEFGNDLASFIAFEKARVRGGARIVKPAIVKASASDVRLSIAKLHGARLAFDAAITGGSTVQLDAASGRGRITGYGAVFNTINRRGFKLIAGAFARSRHQVPLPMLWRHAEPVGRWHEVRQDAHGLYLHGELNLDVELGRRALAHIQHGDTLGLSVGFNVGHAADAVIERDGVLEIHHADLLECSVTPTPAEPAALIDGVK